MEKKEKEQKSGNRPDNRKPNELRKITIEAGVIPSADGSAYLEWGQNKVIASVRGPEEVLPKHLSNPYKAIINYTYRMATFSVSDRKNPRPGRREIEISKISREALEKAVLTEKYPNTEINVFVEILDSNAGTRIAALTAASVALADAGIPMRDLVAGVSIGKANNQLLVDLTKEEEDAEDAVDIPLAIMPSTKEIVLLQLDGLLTPAEWKKALPMGMEACEQVYEIQKKALRKKFEITE